MRARTLIGLLFITALSNSCSNENENLETSIIKKISSSKFSEYSHLGFSGGVTTYAENIQGSTSKEPDKGYFISQYPLAEFRKIFNVEYDSIVEVELDSITQDTISSNMYVVEISRTFTGEVIIGNLWAPYEQYYYSELYMGVPESILDTVTTIAISATVIDSLALEGARGGISISLYNPEIDQSYFLYDGPKQIDSTLYNISDEIPIFNESGEIEKYTSGIKLPIFRLHHQSDDVTQPITRSFNIGVQLGEIFFSKDFSVYFVSEEEWLKRNCWLNQEYECLDYYDE